MKELISTRAFSRAAQSASLLQYGKQGISLVYGKPSNCPDGRLIGTQSLRDVIWQGRNHALHWEEGNPKAAVEDCFQKLAADFDPGFADYATRNLAFAVVEVLGWTSFDAFKADMLTLQPTSVP